MLRQKKIFMAEYTTGMYTCTITNSNGFYGHKELQPEAENIANKIPLVNDFLKFKFLEDIQASIL